MILKRKLKSHGETSDESDLFVYCSSCGEIADYAFKFGDFVSVEDQGRPFFGRIVKIQSSPNGPEAIVMRNKLESEIVGLQYVKPL